MPHEYLQLSPRHRRWFYAIMVVLFCSGAGWLALRTWGQTESEFGLKAHPLEPWLLKLHGAAAMATLLLLGTMIPLHLRRGWRAHRNRRTGTVITTACALLVVSGYALYYAGGESLRRIAVVAHDGLGLALPLILVWHIARGRRARMAASRSP